MRREPLSRPENVLALATAEIERLKVIMARITDGRRLVIGTGTGVGDTTPPVEAGAHTLYGVKHARSLRVTDGGGLNINFEQGQVWIEGIFFTIAAGSLALTDNATNFVFVGIAGAVTSNTTGFPLNSIPLAEVVTLAADITSVNDRRAYLTPNIQNTGSVPAPSAPNTLARNWIGS